MAGYDVGSFHLKVVLSHSGLVFQVGFDFGGVVISQSPLTVPIESSRRQSSINEVLGYRCNAADTYTARSH